MKSNLISLNSAAIIPLDEYTKYQELLKKTQDFDPEKDFIIYYFGGYSECVVKNADEVMKLLNDNYQVQIQEYNRIIRGKDEIIKEQKETINKLKSNWIIRLFTKS